MTKKFHIGRFTIEELQNGNIFYEHDIQGENRSANIEIRDGEVFDIDGDYDVPVVVLAVMLAENYISEEGFKIAFEGRYTKI